MHDPHWMFANKNTTLGIWNVTVALSVSTYLSRWMENHDTRVAFFKKKKKQLDAKILVIFLSYKAKIYILHCKLWLSIHMHA